MQGDSHRRFGCRVFRCQLVNIRQDICGMEWGFESRKVYPVQKLQYGFMRFAQVGWHRGFAIANNPIIFQFGEDYGRGAARARGDSEDVAELEGIGAVPEGKSSAIAYYCLHSYWWVSFAADW